MNKSLSEEIGKEGFFITVTKRELLNHRGLIFTFFSGDEHRPPNLYQ